MRTSFLILTALLILGGSAQAGTPVRTKLTCPVGGERFVHTDTASYSTWGSRPDGKPYGSWTFPMPLPECPKNGLVVFKDFSAAEKRKLARLIASPEYLALRKTDTPHYRAAWLARALNPGAPDSTWLLQQAGWEADESPSLRARYLRELVAAAAVNPQPKDLMERLVLRTRVVNALRELGEFDKALAELRAISVPATVPLSPDDAEEGYTPEDAEENRQGLLQFMKGLEVVIARRDAAPEPLDLIPVRAAAFKCLDAAEAKQALDPLCAADPIAPVVAQVRAAREQ